MVTFESRADLAPLAYDELAARCLQRIDFIERVLDTFSSRFEEDLLQLEVELAACDSNAVALLAHRMKGACGNTAAHELMSHVARIEELAREERLEPVAGCLKEIHSAWSNFRQAAKEVVSRPAVSCAEGCDP